MTQVSYLAGCLTALVLALSACGEPVAVAPPAVGTIQNSELAAAGGTTFLLVDGSSFRRFAADYEGEMAAVTQVVAAQRGRVLASVADGQPLTTARILSADFAAAPPGGSDPALLARFNQAKATGISRRLKRLMRSSQTVKGSGQLEALAVAANTPSLHAVVFWTDAVVNEAGGFNATSASRSDVSSQIRLWAPRLRGLQGRTVVLLGVGRGVHRSETVRLARVLFAGLARAAGFRLRWAQSLEQLSS